MFKVPMAALRKESTKYPIFLAVGDNLDFLDRKAYEESN